MSKTWAEDHASRIAETVKRLRGDRSGQWLSDRTATAGHRVSRTTISELETGKRKHVSTAELSVLAWALGVPPIVLLYPDLPDGVVDVLPDRPVASVAAAAWFAGDRDLARPYPNLDDAITPGEDLVRLARARAAIFETLARMNYSKPQSLDTQAGADDLGAMGFILKQIDELNNQLSRVDGAKIATAFPGKFTAQPTDDDGLLVWYEPPTAAELAATATTSATAGVTVTTTEAHDHAG